MIHYIEPVTAPRQVRSDTWRPRPGVLKYRAFKDEVRLKNITLPSIPCKITFYLEMPKSWSAKKKASMNGQPHTGNIDVDNMTKALLDAIYPRREGKSDGHVWSIWIEKRWSETPHIAIEKLVNGL
jgi:Holliday junction resolvase RusA-like endonuclease